mgnify:CR=1 FL=1
MSTDNGAKAASVAAPPATREEKESLGALEEDDEFEEFPAEGA